MKEYVVGFRIDRKSDLVLLIEKQRPAWQKGYLNGVGGNIEPGEAPLKAMVREFEEETGMLVEDWENTVVLSGPGYQIYFFRSFGEIDEAKTTTDEVLIPIRLSSWNMFNIIPNLTWLIPLQLDKIDWPVVMRDTHEQEADHVDGGK
ncbi:hypothetical protein LCGC14_0430590 [marine sediment metagenome]|uniref:Nudix hydrolase domain-containing protein n=1 Tax=marine sediment metagenome TaxID=412755 RepID=A0A0F9VAA9_9ZZZZ